jgi:hypothetical protein
MSVEMDGNQDVKKDAARRTEAQSSAEGVSDEHGTTATQSAQAPDSPPRRRRKLLLVAPVIDFAVYL